VTSEQLAWLAKAISRLVGFQVLAASADSPQKLTEDFRGYAENFQLNAAWEEVITDYETKILLALGPPPPD
jgi:hypothetical protein